MAKIHQWKMEDVASPSTDDVGTLDGTITGTTRVPGIFGYARQFTGAGSDVIALNGGGGTLNLPNDFSVSSWLYLTADKYNYILSKYVSAGNKRSFNFAIYQPNLTPKITLSADGINATLNYTSPFSLSLNTLYNVVWNKLGNDVRIYVNAAEVGFADWGGAGTIYSSTEDAHLGNYNPAADAMSGWLDNVEIWDNGRTPTDIAAAYYAALAPFIELCDPDNGAINIPRNKEFDITISRLDPYNVVKSTVELKLLSNVTQMMYDGDAGTPGFQSGFQGPNSDDPAGGTNGYAFHVDPQSLLYETFIYGLEIYAEDDNTPPGVLHEIRYFDTETIDGIKNSGFEAPDPTEVGWARWWGHVGSDPGGQLGTKRGRVNNPPDWTPLPEGSYAQVQGSIDVNEDIGDEFFQEDKPAGYDVDTTPYDLLAFAYYIKVPDTIPVGRTWYVRVVMDDVVILWEKSYTVGDEDTIETGLGTMDTSAITGIHTFKWLTIFDEGLFDGGVYSIETLESWFMGPTILGGTLTWATYDSGTKIEEDFGDVSWA